MPDRLPVYIFSLFSPFNVLDNDVACMPLGTELRNDFPPNVTWALSYDIYAFQGLLET